MKYRIVGRLTNSSEGCDLMCEIKSNVCAYSIIQLHRDILKLSLVASLV